MIVDFCARNVGSKMKYWFPVAAFLYLASVSFLYTDGLATIVKNQSAYEGLVVAVHSSVPEDEKYLDVLRELIRNTSKTLYKATDGSAYFRSVTIALPETWNKTKTPSPVYENQFPSAHIRVLPPIPGAEQVTAPYTLQPGGCGEQGEYIELRTDFLTAEPSLLQELYGPKDRMIVREWAHFRFGVFDEYGIPGHNIFPLFHFNDGFMEVSSCPSWISGWIWSDKTGDTCDVYEDRVASDCIFIPDTSDNSIESSLMSITKLPKVDHFCNNSESQRTHNSRAPTKQNLLCQGRSTLDVISSHSDFSDKRKSALENTVFTVTRLEKIPPRYVLILDLSESMKGQPLKLMKQACSWFITQQIPDGSYLGIVGFSTNAWTISGIDVVNRTSREKFSGAVQGLKYVSATSIGAGLKEAVFMLRKTKLRTNGAKLILLTDGEENRLPYISTTMALLLESGVAVHTVALGSSASTKLEKLATDTNGRSYFFPKVSGVSTAELKQIFLETITVHGDIDVERMELFSQQYILTNNTKVINVRVDKEMGKNTQFSVSSENITDIVFRLQSPKGDIYNQSSTEFHKDHAATSSESFMVTSAEEGLWTIFLNKTSKANLSVDVRVVSEPTKVHEDPVRVRSWINATNVQFPNSPKVFAHVTKGIHVVIRASVQATITSDTGRTIRLTLNDRGKGADAISDDGVYSAYFSDFKSTEKRYTVVAEVGSTGTALIRSTSRRTLYAAAAASLPPKDQNGQKKGKPTNKFTMDHFRKVDVDPDQDKPEGDPVDDFERVTNAGSFIVEGKVVENQDRIKPSPIKDLTILSTERFLYSNNYGLTVSLRWTAPGDDMDSGKAKFLDLRGGNSNLTRDTLFTLGYSFPNDNKTVVNGSLGTVEGGTEQFATVILPSELQDDSGKAFDVQFSMRAVDEKGNIGDMGNIVTAHFGYSIAERKNDIPKKDDGGSDKLVVIVSVVVPVIVLIAVVIGVLIYRKRH